MSHRIMRKLRFMVLLMLLVLTAGSLQACASGKSSTKQESAASKDRGKESASARPDEDGSPDYETLELDEDASYDTKDEVCAYLVQFHKLPSNYMTKKEARSKGWEGGALNQVISGKCIGGDYFGNYEKLLPVIDGRDYHECDIDTLGRSGRGARRIIYSGDDENGDWNIYYTEDHYESFTLLWGEDDS